MLNGLEYLLAALAALAAGAVNALAGGGTLITFPMLTCDQHCGTLSRLFWGNVGPME
jgi:hypothetical protein